MFSGLVHMFKNTVIWLLASHAVIRPGIKGRIPSQVSYFLVRLRGELDYV